MKGLGIGSTMGFSGAPWGSLGKATQQLGRYQGPATPALGGSYRGAIRGLSKASPMADLYSSISADLRASTAQALDSVPKDLAAHHAAFATQALARQTQAVRPGRIVALYKAAEALRTAALAPDPVGNARAAALLRRASREVSQSRPRHAAVALAAWDALTSTKDPFGTLDRRKVLLSIAQDLLSQFVSVERETEILNEMDDVGLERFPAFESTVVSALSSA